MLFADDSLDPADCSFLCPVANWEYSVWQKTYVSAAGQIFFWHDEYVVDGSDIWSVVRWGLCRDKSKDVFFSSLREPWRTTHVFPFQFSCLAWFKRMCLAIFVPNALTIKKKCSAHLWNFTVSMYVTLLFQPVSLPVETNLPVSLPVETRTHRSLPVETRL